MASAYEDKARGEPLHPSQVQNAVSPLKRQVGAPALPRGQRKPSAVAKMSTVHRPSWSRGRGLPKTKITWKMPNLENEFQLLPSENVNLF